MVFAAARRVRAGFSTSRLSPCASAIGACAASCSAARVSISSSCRWALLIVGASGRCRRRMSGSSAGVRAGTADSVVSIAEAHARRRDTGSARTSGCPQYVMARRCAVQWRLRAFRGAVPQPGTTHRSSPRCRRVSRSASGAENVRAGDVLEGPGAVGGGYVDAGLLEAPNESLDRQRGARLAAGGGNQSASAKPSPTRKFF